MRKKAAVLAAALIVTVIAQGSTFAPLRGENSVWVYVNGQRIDKQDYTYVVNDTAYVPLYETAAALGATTIVWNSVTKTAEVKANGLIIKASAGAQYIEANGRCIYVPDGCSMKDGCLMVSARAIAKAFGATVAWVELTKSIHFIPSGRPIESGDSFYDTDELTWLSKIIHAEACGECIEGKIAVGNVVLNRKADSSFPNTVKGVVFDRNAGVQFTPAYTGAIYNKPSAESIAAAKLALEGTDIVGDCLYFTSAALVNSSWAGRNREHYKLIENQMFYM